LILREGATGIDETAILDGVGLGTRWRMAFGRVMLLS
jgi:hypothetical protein